MRFPPASRSGSGRATLFGLFLGLIGALGCADLAGFDGNPQMDPGQDCLSCHSPRGAASSLGFSLGGTVYSDALEGAEGGLFNAEIELRDAVGRRYSLQSNGAGNFFTAETLTFPVSVAIKVGGQTFAMDAGSPTGQCNACHQITVNADGAFAPAPLPDFALDAGFTIPPPGRIYGSASLCATPANISCPSSPPSFQGQVGALIQSNCLPCHALGGNVPDLESYSQTADNATSVLVQVAGCKMPPLDGTWFPMSDDERQLLMQWLACGAPPN